MSVKLFAKGVLLYVTLLVIIISIMAIESIYDNGYLFADILIVAILIYACKKTISKDESEVLTFNKNNNE